MKLYEKAILSFINFINKVLFYSLKKEIVFPEETKSIINSGKVIIAMWHGKMFTAVYFFPKKLRKKMYPLVSQSKDGELIAYILKKQGFKTEIRGSSSRGGLKALSTMVKKLNEGSIVLITPDGPRGPRRELKDGIILVAQKTNSPIVGMSFIAEKVKVFNSWDKFELPLPFSKIKIVFSKPYIVDSKDLAIHKKRIEKLLNSLDLHEK